MKDKYKSLMIIDIITILLIILIILLLESNNNKCTRKVQAKLKCPDGYTDYTDNKCINFSEGYEINEDDTCPDGYGYLMQLSLFGPNTYKCHPIKDYIYVCDEGTLINNECYITIDAIEN